MICLITNSAFPSSGHALSKFVSTPNMPNSGNRYSSDEDEANDEEQPREPVPMETDAKPR